MTSIDPAGSASQLEHPGPLDHPGPPDAPENPELRDQAEGVLRALVGREDARLRDDQWRAIEALVGGSRRVLVVQRTGWGKSAVYFVATALRRRSGAGPTVIVSPLLALMRDQIAAASRAGITAVTLNSTNVQEWDEVHADIARGAVDVLLVSPERLNNPAFRDQVLPRLAADAGLVVVDEAHCISDWGHDFRPDYRRIRTLLADLPGGVPVLATTATANERVTRDVAEQLGGAGEVLVLRGSLDRPALHLGVVELADDAARIAWLAGQLPRWDGSGIIYALTVSAAHTVAEQLRAAGLEVRAYTGRTEPAEREELEADLKANRVKALVATSALGMGFDKPDLAFVVHLGSPSSPVAYYQQVGRAGRGVDRADVVLLPGREDRAIWQYFASLAFPPEESVRTVLDVLGDGQVRSTPVLETAVDLRRTRLETMLKVLDVDGAVRRVRGGWESTGQPWTYDAARYERVEDARRREADAMLAYARLEPPECRMAVLRTHLDDPDLEQGWRCGRCDLCGGMELAATVDAEAAQQARSGLDRPGLEIEARRQWPSGMDRLGIDLSGKIPPAERAETGLAVGRLDGVGLAGALRGTLGTGAADGPVPPELVGPLRQTLTAWAAGAEPVAGIVAVDSTTRPQLVRDLAVHVSQVLGVPVVGALVPEPGSEPGRHDVNSASRLASVSRRLRMGLSEAALAGLPGRRVLLVDDSTDSGWTLTVAARMLRLAGADAVVPFVLGVV
ncbi:RecQ family ATP-dependent DNA helicase [Georgenia sp. Z1344]|uniref:RecQ family ATP-dependent DNA helicase n=1 Tax=Georgenia sp. Z1344 TaxID=3416706 RepID=UPI003CF88F73